MSFEKNLKRVRKEYDVLINTKNRPKDEFNGIYKRYANTILTRNHVPIEWRFDLDQEINPFLQERLGINAVFNPGAIQIEDRTLLVARVEGNDRKSFFAIAESDSAVDGFRFWDKPISMPETENPDTNVYDMRLVNHEDGWIYGTFCTERKDQNTSEGDTVSAVSACGIARTKDLKTWERLPDLVSHSGQQRNVVLHPEFINGKYALYTRPQDGFISVGGGGGIGWGLTNSMENAEIPEERIIDNRQYHTIKEMKNGLGPAPIKTTEGWLHLAHGVRNTAAGLRYVLYLFMTFLDEPWRRKYSPGGHFMAPLEDERVGDVSNVLFSNGWVVKEGSVYIYYASSDTRIHVAESSIDQLVDYVRNTPEDGFRSANSVQQRLAIIDKNHALKNKARRTYNANF